MQYEAYVTGGWGVIFLIIGVELSPLSGVLCRHMNELSWLPEGVRKLALNRFHLLQPYLEQNPASPRGRRRGSQSLTRRQVSVLRSLKLPHLICQTGIVRGKIQFAHAHVRIRELGNFFG
jgi:hypothetical protein